MTTEATPVVESPVTEQPAVAPPPVATPEPVPAASQPMSFNTADLGAELAAAASADAIPGTPSNVQEFGFDSDDIKQYDFDLYKGRKGVTDRIGLLALPLGARVHFKTGIGYFQCLSTYKTQMVGGQKLEVCVRRAACCQHCDAPRKRFITPITQYNTRPDGQLLPEFGYQLKAWLYSDDKYIMMRQIHKEFPLLDHDVMVTCTEESYQKLTLTPCAQALWKLPKLPQQMKDDIKLWVEQMRPKMGKMLGKAITEAEFLQKAGLVTTPAVAANADAPMVDLKELLA